jgi:catechol 2,3-dioxygenase-like lactoylglutathione lyase family enzyme
VTSRIVSLPISCTDPARLAAFWCTVLGWEVKDEGWQRTEHGADGVTIHDEARTLEIDFRWVADTSRTGPNRLHLDVVAVDGDQAAELRRLLAAGAREVDVGQRPDSTWHVLADPEGNEFCLCRGGT